MKIVTRAFQQSEARKCGWKAAFRGVYANQVPTAAHTPVRLLNILISRSFSLKATTFLNLPQQAVRRAQLPSQSPRRVLQALVFTFAENIGRHHGAGRDTRGIKGHLHHRDDL
jgi:hypothetical protein